VLLKHSKKLCVFAFLRLCVKILDLLTAPFSFYLQAFKLPDEIFISGG